MNCNYFTRLTGSKRKLLALLASSAVFMAGCANMATTATSSNSLDVAAAIGGRVHGGNQPVGGAVVNLYYAGQTGMGSGDPSAGPGLGAPILAATTTSANDGTGSFSFIQDPINGETTTGNTFSCPVNNPIVYVVARGGNTLNTQDSSVNNAASVFIGVYGLCNQIANSSFIDLSEVTTVATMAALQQYFNPGTESIGADGIAASKQALVNSIATISNLVNLATGTARSASQISSQSAYFGNGATAVTVTATPDTAKINQLANIISACVNNAAASASACTTLFANATPPNVSTTSRPYHAPAFAPATDVLQAVYYMLTNPTNGGTTNLQNLFSLSPALGAPYQPTLSTAPTDWTISITYSSNSTCGTNNGNFIYKPQALSIDVNGNVWMSNGQAGTGNLTEISASGVPTTCLPLGASRGAAIDTLGNVWYASTDSNNIYRYSPGTTPGVPQALLAFPTTQTPLAVAADGSGNVYFSTVADTSLYEIPAAATATAVVAPVQISSVLGPLPISLMADKTGSIWASSGSNFVSRVTTGNVGDPNYLNGFSTTAFNTLDSTYGIAVTQSNGVFVSSNGTSSALSYLTGSGVSYATTPGWPTAAGLGGINTPESVVLDGAQNVWTANNSNDSVSGMDTISEISIFGVSLTPNGTTNGGLQQSSSFSGGRSIIIDQSGNVWIAGDGTSGNPSNFVTEIVGTGVPIYQPYALGLSNTRFQTVP
ncbi:hypothetical protein EDE15_0439 [Edaphobacter aggregans]|uniref:NHL repeat containing protein n=1 Tax=Edaphobacter aggregans TaxID=570835 RepID=A0A428MDM5_9BACT|nr:hypothetical protein [Edaphobacter aggregans]RSL14969.1 hypothetical protein EDE15_0439 [Edaphobacter aggregans]